MKTHKITRRSRKIGWGYSFKAIQFSDGLSILPPAGPDYTGTVKQVLEAKQDDMAFNNRGGAFAAQRWFYNGKPIQDEFIEFDLELLVEGELDEVEVTTE